MLRLKLNIKKEKIILQLSLLLLFYSVKEQLSNILIKLIQKIVQCFEYITSKTLNALTINGFKNTITHRQSDESTQCEFKSSNRLLFCFKWRLAYLINSACKNQNENNLHNNFEVINLSYSNKSPEFQPDQIQSPEGLISILVKNAKSNFKLISSSLDKGVGKYSNCTKEVLFTYYSFLFVALYKIERRSHSINS